LNECVDIFPSRRWGKTVHKSAMPSHITRPKVQQ